MTKTIITPIPDLKVPSSPLYWIGKDSWPPIAHQFYLNSTRAFSSLTIMKRPPIYKYEKSRWQHQVFEFILKGENQLLSWCEVQLFGGKIRQGLFFSNLADFSAGDKNTTIGLLITAAIINYDIDIIKIMDESLSFPLGELKSYLTFSRGSQRPLRKNYLELSREQWMERFQGEDFVRSLRFLQIRKIRQKNTKKNPPKKRGLIARIFRPRIEDSIF